ncbi:hypothetical protein [Acidocella sp.]|uniref:hypothetical protein n=1 Tax=Acidocella sp. TaxID=50710 RepID=UPI0018232069|nr:hypothetical protein [Acidocella sp.]NNM56666.1 hypothetical protein [Acidocella sp.]
MLSEDDKKRIEAEEEYRAKVRAKIPSNIQKTDLGQRVERTRKGCLIIVFGTIGGVILLGIIGSFMN